MNLNISLDEPLATQLRTVASARSLSPEQAASDLLCGALGSLVEDQAWLPVNRRRGELIRKHQDVGLTAEEGQELDQLQANVDQRLAPTDEELLGLAERFRRLAEGLPDTATP